MKTTSKLLLAAVALSLIGTAPLYADDATTRRIVHPNGESTYVTVPREDRSPTIGVYAGDRSFRSDRQVLRSDAQVSVPTQRTILVNRGRGQVDQIQVQR